MSVYFDPPLSQPMWSSPTPGGQSLDSRPAAAIRIEGGAEVGGLLLESLDLTYWRPRFAIAPHFRVTARTEAGSIIVGRVPIPAVRVNPRGFYIWCEGVTPSNFTLLFVVVFPNEAEDLQVWLDWLEDQGVAGCTRWAG